MALSERTNHMNELGLSLDVQEMVETIIKQADAAKAQITTTEWMSLIDQAVQDVADVDTVTRRYLDEALEKNPDIALVFEEENLTVGSLLEIRDMSVEPIEELCPMPL